MTIGERIKNNRKRLGLSQVELAKSANVSKQTLYKYEKNIITNIPLEKVETIANSLNTTPSYLMGWDDEKLKQPNITEDVITFPVIGEIAAGYDEIAVEDWSGETVDIPASLLKGRRADEFFVLSVHGDSMYPMYQDGDIVLILKQSTLERSGDVGAVIYDDDNATLKRIEYVKGENWMKLIPINPEFMPKMIENEDLEHCRVIGIPKLLIRNI